MTTPDRTYFPATRESAIFMAAGEPFAAGFFEQPNAPMASRHADAIHRYLEAAPPLPVLAGAPLYPSGAGNVWTQLPEADITFAYSHSLSLRADPIGKLLPHCADEFERHLIRRALGEIRHWCGVAIPPRFCIGGNGYTHSILNYGRWLREGLTGCRARIHAALARHAADESRTRLLQAMEKTLEAIMAYHARCVRHVSQARDAATGAEQQRLTVLAAALGKVPLKPAESFYEALVAFNFLWNLDGCDSVGRFDQDLSAYFDADLKAGRLDETTAAGLLAALWANFDANEGWHLLLGGADTVSSRFTRLCVKTMAPFRRPNAGIRVHDGMPDDLWETIFDGWQAGGVNPALYNEAAYAKGIASLSQIEPAMKHQFACGGCTELMFHGASNVGSIDAGVNLLEVFERSLRAHLEASDSYAAFLTCFKHDAAAEIDAAIDTANLNQQHMAQFRPQLIRSLFIDDCIGRGLEYNAGGAIVNGAVINVAGLTNVINSLLVLEQVFTHRLAIPKANVLPMLAANFAGYEAVHAQIAAVKKFGNAVAEADAIAHDLSTFVFEKIRARHTWRGNGYCVPGVIMFVTYTGYGAYVGATPDGRRNGEPLADSAGAVQGSDLEGPTSLLSAAASLRHDLGTGTLVLNLRLDPAAFTSPGGRAKLKALIQTYFKLGGLQLQVTTVNPQLLRDAIQEPRKHANVMVRIGGYSEYFTRLPGELQSEVLKRIEHGL